MENSSTTLVIPSQDPNTASQCAYTYEYQIVVPNYKSFNLVTIKLYNKSVYAFNKHKSLWSFDFGKQ